MRECCSIGRSRPIRIDNLTRRPFWKKNPISREFNSKPSDATPAFCSIGTTHLLESLPFLCLSHSWIEEEERFHGSPLTDHPAKFLAHAVRTLQQLARDCVGSSPGDRHSAYRGFTRKSLESDLSARSH